MSVDVSRRRLPENMGRTVNSKKRREVSWDYSMHSFESNRSKFEYDAPLYRHPVELIECID